MFRNSIEQEVCIAQRVTNTIETNKFSSYKRIKPETQVAKVGMKLFPGVDRLPGNTGSEERDIVRGG